MRLEGVQRPEEENGRYEGAPRPPLHCMLHAIFAAICHPPPCIISWKVLTGAGSFRSHFDDLLGSAGAEISGLLGRSTRYHFPWLRASNNYESDASFPDRGTYINPSSLDRPLSLARLHPVIIGG